MTNTVYAYCSMKCFIKKGTRRFSQRHTGAGHCNERTTDLVLLDMKIPGMDGIEILKRMKMIDESIRVIIMTAYGELDMIKESKELGALTHFAKPFDIDEIRDAVKKYLPLKSN